MYPPVSYLAQREEGGLVIPEERAREGYSADLRVLRVGYRSLAVCLGDLMFDHVFDGMTDAAVRLTNARIIVRAFPAGDAADVPRP